MADFLMRGLYLGEATTLVSLGPDALRQSVADLPRMRWRPAGRYQALAPLCRQPAQAAGSRTIQQSEFPIRETWYVLQCEADSSDAVGTESGDANGTPSRDPNLKA